MAAVLPEGVRDQHGPKWSERPFGQDALAGTRISTRETNMVHIGLRWPGDSQRESGRFVRIDSQKKKKSLFERFARIVREANLQKNNTNKYCFKILGFSICRVTLGKPFARVCFAQIFCTDFCTDFLHEFFARIFCTEARSKSC